MSDETAVVPYVEPERKVRHYTHEDQKRAAAGPGGKFNAARRRAYLELRRAGRSHHTSLYSVGISVSTYDRYSAAAGEMWKAEVRAAREHSLDPIRDKRRELALAGEPWAIDREIGKGRDRGGEEDPHGGRQGAGGTTVNVGVGVMGAGGVGIAVEGGAQGVDGALAGMLERLRERAALERLEAQTEADG